MNQAVKNPSYPLESPPEGYCRNARGHFVPVDQVSDFDRLKDETILELITAAKQQREALQALKADSFASIATLIQLGAERYDVKVGGAKGNVILYSFDGRYKVQRQMHDVIRLDERIEAAKVLIYEFVSDKTAEADQDLKMLVDAVFNTDQDGNLSITRVLSLRQYPIKHDKWIRAMQILTDSIMVVDTTAFVRFYERDENGVYQPISLDIAKL